MTAVGLDDETIARLTARHGSPELAAAKAKQDPRFTQAFREVERDQLGAVAFGPWETAGDRNSAATVEWWKLVAAWDLLDKGEGAADDGRGALLPTSLVERAVQLHFDEQLGRRKLDGHPELPGMTDWYARQILSWVDRGAPTGLWLDGRRLRWGSAITPVWLDREQLGAGSAPSCSHLRLPRI